MYLLSQPFILALQRLTLFALLAQLQVDVDQSRLFCVHVHGVGNDNAASTGYALCFLLLFDGGAKRILKTLRLPQSLAQLGDLAVFRFKVPLKLGFHLDTLQVVKHKRLLGGRFHKCLLHRFERIYEF